MEERVVFDISSDEEPALDVAVGGEDYGWLKKLLCDDVDDSDEVVVVGEIKSKSSELTLKARNNDDDDDDDDCVILDGDPDKAVAVDDHKAGDDSGDLVIVSHKGQVACRDYPHSRHLCAKFNFSSTAHERHCDLCHCYVCDIPAPCAHWGAGINIIDHCHATEKEEFWKSQRKSFRLEKNPLLPAQAQVPDTSLPLSQRNQTTARDIVRLSSNSLPQNQVSRPAVIRGCSNSRRLTIPNMISQFRSQQSLPALSRNRIPRRSISQSQNLRVHNPGMFKRAVNAKRGVEVDTCAYGSNNIGSVYGSQTSHNLAPLATSNDRINVSWVSSMNHDSFTCQSTSQTGLGNVFMGMAPSQPQLYSQALPQPEVYSQPMPQPLLYSQPIPAPQLSTQPIPQPQVYLLPSPPSNEGHTVSELGNRMQNPMGPAFSEFDDWVSNTSQSNQQPQVENCQVPRTGCANGPLTAEQFNPLCNGSATLHHNNYSEFENWYPDSQFGPVPAGYVPPELNAVTSEPAAYDAGMLLFDFETSFNGLMHA